MRIRLRNGPRLSMGSAIRCIRCSSGGHLPASHSHTSTLPPGKRGTNQLSNARIAFKLLPSGHHEIDGQSTRVLSHRYGRRVEPKAGHYTVAPCSHQLTAITRGCRIARRSMNVSGGGRLQALALEEDHESITEAKDKAEAHIFRTVFQLLWTGV